MSAETFDERYPDAEIWFQPPPDPYNEVIKVREARPCCQCGTSTQFVELNFEAHICSEGCNDRIWKEYFEAINRKRCCICSVCIEEPYMDAENQKWDMCQKCGQANA